MDVVKMTTIKNANFVDAALIITVLTIGFIAVLFAF